MLRTQPRSAFILLVWFTLLTPTFAAEKKDDKKPEPPRVIMSLPLAVEPGTNITIRLRGLGLADATALRFTPTNAALTATLKSKAKADVPKDYDAKRVGDSQLEVELKLPTNLIPGPLALIISTPAGDTAPYSLTLTAAGSLLAEKEPNGGFRSAQDIKFGQTIRGTIGEPNDVDVFRFTGRKGETIIASVNAARAGSALDGILLLHDHAGHLLATIDDSENSADPILKLRLPADGTYFLSLIDAHDRGSALHPYLLTLERAENR